MRKCPVSGKDMHHKKVHGVEVDVSDGYGIWLDKGEFLTISEQVRTQEPSFMWADLWRGEKKGHVADERTLDCPVCGTKMDVDLLHGVHIDWCKNDGVWLDNGELDAILNNLRLDPLYVRKVATRLWEARY